MSLWEYGDIGFDTFKLKWFLLLFDKSGEIVGAHYVDAIRITNGFGVQVMWRDKKIDTWHIRERIRSENVLGITVKNEELEIIFKPQELNSDTIPDEFSYLTYAYSTKNGRGFVEFYDMENVLVKRLSDKWILVENLRHQTAGEYPNIRLKVLRGDIERTVVTRSCLIIIGKPKWNALRLNNEIAPLNEFVPESQITPDKPIRT